MAQVVVQAFADTQERAQPKWLDVGLCSPTTLGSTILLNLSGSSSPNWMGDQISDTGQPLAWIYRGRAGLFRIAQHPLRLAQNMAACSEQVTTSPLRAILPLRMSLRSMTYRKV